MDEIKSVFYTYLVCTNSLRPTVCTTPITVMGVRNGVRNGVLFPLHNGIYLVTDIK